MSTDTNNDDQSNEIVDVDEKNHRLRQGSTRTSTNNPGVSTQPLFTHYGVSAGNLLNPKPKLREKPVFVERTSSSSSSEQQKLTTTKEVPLQLRRIQNLSPRSQQLRLNERSKTISSALQTSNVVNSFTNLSATLNATTELPKILNNNNTICSEPNLLQNRHHTYETDKENSANGSLPQIRQVKDN